MVAPLKGIFGLSNEFIGGYRISHVGGGHGPVMGAWTSEVGMFHKIFKELGPLWGVTPGSASGFVHVTWV